MTPEAGRTESTVEVASVLGAAFDADPLFRWIFPDPDQHADQVNAWWDFMVTRRPPGSELWEAGRHRAVAFWMAPVGGPPGAVDAADFQAAFIELMDALLGDLAEDRLEFFGRIMEAHPAEPHWYLSAVGTHPAAQGRGLGTVVLAPRLARCDDDGVPAYLESSNPRNQPFYFRHGFRITGEIEPDGGGPPVTFMWREPSP